MNLLLKLKVSKFFNFHNMPPFFPVFKNKYSTHMYPKSPTSSEKTTVLGVISGDWLPKGLDTDQVESLIKDYQRILGLSFLNILNVFHF